MITREMQWFEKMENLIQLAKFMEYRASTTSDIIYMFEKPWMFGDIYDEMLGELAYLKGRNK
jgi:hypothetical protein